MTTKCLLLACTFALFLPEGVHAQNNTALNLRAASEAHAVAPGPVKAIDARELERRIFGVKRGPALTSLYGTLAGLNALDVITTRRVIGKGGSEVNPLMKPVAGSTHLMTGLKLATTAATILMIDRTAKKSRRTAIVSAAICNAVMAAVVTHNLRQLR